jgi:hypothetical protein
MADESSPRSGSSVRGEGGGFRGDLGIGCACDVGKGFSACGFSEGSGEEGGGSLRCCVGWVYGPKASD